MLRRSSCLAILLLVLSACGLKGDEKEAAEALSGALQKEYTGLSAGDADCVAEHWVKAIGLAALRKADLIGDNNTVVGDVRDTELSESNANEAVDAFDDCTDFRKLAVGMVTTLFESDESQSACIDKAVTDEAAHAWALSDLQGQVTDNVFVVGGRGCMATDEENARAVQSLKGSFGDADGIGRDQARCVAQGLVDTIGTYELTAAGILDEKQGISGPLKGTPLNATDANLAADVIAGCVSVEDMLTASMVGGGEKGQGPEVKACFAEAFDDATFHSYLVDTLMGGEGKLDATTTERLATCLADIVKKEPKTG